MPKRNQYAPTIEKPFQAPGPFQHFGRVDPRAGKQIDHIAKMRLNFQAGEFSIMQDRVGRAYQE
ncbi:MAG: hypothetical protein ACK56I_14820, partial [bacterium]